MADVIVVEPGAADVTDEATEPAEAPPPDEPEADGPPRRARPSGWTLRMAGLAVALVMLAIVDVALLARSVDPVAAQRESALVAARDVALDLSSIGAANAQERLARLDAVTTGPFRDNLGGYAELLADMLRQGGVRAEATVTAAGIERIDAETAVALVLVTATVTDTATPQGEVRRYRLAIEMQRAGDAWLTSNVAYIP